MGRVAAAAVGKAPVLFSSALVPLPPLCLAERGWAAGCGTSAGTFVFVFLCGHCLFFICIVVWSVLFVCLSICLSVCCMSVFIYLFIY